VTFSVVYFLILKKCYNLLLSLVVICVWALDRVNPLFYICEENSVKKFNEFKNQGAFY